MTPELLPDNDPALDQFAHDVAVARANSYPLLFAAYRVAPTPSAEPTALLDAMAVAVGFEGLGAGWIAVPRRIALKLLTQIIGSELAYPEEVVPREHAEALAQR
ncbi:MAG: hypothetical protein EI684_15775, partial [Candidatus Viridilinea halotolerans]